MSKNLQALVFDLDGTAIPVAIDGVPSVAVIAAVAAAKKLCHVSVATGRTYEECQLVLEALNIEDICILNGGSHLYSRKTNEYLWKLEVDQPTLAKVFQSLQQFNHYLAANEKRPTLVPLTEYQTDEPVGLAWISGVSKADADVMVEILNAFENINVHAVASWKIGAFDIHITNKLATKKHALQSLLEKIQVDPKHTMVVGDGTNDVPLFELAGWKVAMGNATQVLKERADWIAPTVAEDGLAVAIHKFILDS